MNQKRWDRALDLHTAAAAELVKSASAVPAAQWNVPRTERKWSPAQVVEHLTLAYEALLRELRGEPGMRYRAGPVMRFVYRLIFLPRILRGGSFPRAAAPRETRPAEVLTTQTDAIDRFHLRSEEFERAVREAPRRTNLTHAYFGRLNLLAAVTFCARHINHHRRQLS